MGRRKPYTQIGIKRLKCFRCGAQAKYQWQICSDENTFRPVCKVCDIELNELVLRFMRFPEEEIERKMVAYRKKVRE
jgi:hypothetical protein